MSDDKIIPFPTDRIKYNKNVGANEKYVEDVNKIREEQTKQFIETAVDDIAMMLLKNFVDLAMKTDKPTFTKDLALLIDILRGMIYRDFNIEYPAQKLIDELVILNSTKSGELRAKIDYSKIVGKTKQTNNPLSKDFKKELKDIQDSAGLFEGEDINDD